jgi:hypothetical protein
MAAVAAVAAVVAGVEVEEEEEAVVEVAADSKNDCEYPFPFLPLLFILINLNYLTA